MKKTKTDGDVKNFAVALSRQWADEMASIIKPYLLPSSTTLDNLPILYAWEIVLNGPFLIARVRREDNGSPAAIHIPMSFVMLVFETDNERMQIGFIDKSPESKSDLSHLITFE